MVTISMGVAEFDFADGMSIEQWLNDADTALYDAKASGRNRVRLANEQAIGQPDADAPRAAHRARALGGQLERGDRGDDGEDQQQADRRRRLVEKGHADDHRADRADPAPHRISGAHRDRCARQVRAAPC